MERLKLKELLDWYNGKHRNVYSQLNKKNKNFKVTQIEAGKSNGKLNSLKAFRSYNEKSTAIKISANNYGYDKENDILTIPLYEVFLLADDIANDNNIIKN